MATTCAGSTGIAAVPRELTASQVEEEVRDDLLTPRMGYNDIDKTCFFEYLTTFYKLHSYTEWYHAGTALQRFAV